MKAVLTTLGALALSVALAAPSSAQVVTSRGMATVSYPGSLKQADKDKAYRAAQVASVERYFAEAGEAESSNFDDIAAKVEAGLDKFVLSTVVLGEQDQSGMRKYTVTLRTELNVAKLRNTLRGAAAPASKAPMVYVFLAREVAAVKSFDARVVQREDTSFDAQAATTRKNGRTGASMRTSASVETGGSVTQKSDELSYRLLPMSGHKTAVTSVFSQSGFTVADPEFVLADGDMKAVNHDYSKGNDVTPSTLRALVASLRKAGVPTLVLATFDVGTPSQDDATGLARVGVTVTARVLDLSGALPREVAAVPPVQYAGLAADHAAASTKALKDASLAASREIVSRIQAAN